MTDSVRPHRQQPTKLLLSLGFSRQEYRSGLPFPSPMHESEKWKWNRSVVPDSWWPHGLQPTRLFRPWDFQGKSTGVGCHCLLRSAHYRLCKNGGRLPCIDLNGIPRGGASRSRCKVKFLKQGAGYPWGLYAGHLHWTPLVDLEAVLSPVPWGLCNLFSFFFFFFFFFPLWWAAQSWQNQEPWDSASAWPCPQRFPPEVHRGNMRLTLPRGQSDCRRGHLAANHRWQRAPGGWGGASGLRRRPPLGLPQA